LAPIGLDKFAPVFKLQPGSAPVVKALKNSDERRPCMSRIRPICSFWLYNAGESKDKRDAGETPTGSTGFARSRIAGTSNIGIK
jgi:hypothetical protein